MGKEGTDPVYPLTRMSQFKSKILSCKLQAASENGVRVLLTIEPTTELPKGIIQLSLAALINAGFKRDEEFAAKKAIEMQIAAGGCDVTYDVRENKQGAAWQSRNGQVGQFKKDWNQPVNIDLIINPAIVKGCRVQYSSAAEEALLSKASFEQLAMMTGLSASIFALPEPVAPKQIEDIPAPVGNPTVVQPEPVFAGAENATN